TLGYPLACVVAEQDVSGIRVSPLTAVDLQLYLLEPQLSIPPTNEGGRRGTHHSVRASVTSLVPARRALTDAPETPLRHHATALRPRHRTTTGATVPALMNSSSTLARIRTCRPTFTNSIRRSAI